MQNPESWNGKGLEGKTLGCNKHHYNLNKKHILLVVRHPVGGIRTFLRYVYRNFDSSEWRFTIVAPEVEEISVLLQDLEEIDLTWVKIWKTAGPWKIAKAVFRQLVQNRFDVVHSHGFTSGMCAAVPAFICRTPHLMTSHDVINENQFSGINGKFKRMGMTLLFALIDKVQSVSYDAQDNLLSFFPGLGKHDRKVIVIPNGIETRRFLDAEAINLRDELHLDGNAFIIGFFGRFMKQKGFVYLIEAIEMLTEKEKELPKQPVVVTFGEGGFMSREKRLIKKKDIETHFRHMPFTPNIAGLIKGVEVVAMPSLWEACGLLAMETLVCGTPLIVSDCIGLREVTRETPAIKVPSRNSESLAEAIIGLIQNPQKEAYTAFAPAAIEMFDVKERAKMLQKIYSNLICKE